MRRRAPALMVQGTSSGAGKTWLSVALCRIYARRGLTVRPFKAQNMSNNAAVTADGGEIGRAQWLQALAARVAPDVRMNPVLLKPMADTQSDVVLMGRSQRALSSLPWHERRDVLWPCVAEALASLRSEADLVVIEGAGSPAEINLRRSDIVNMAVAHEADASVLVVTDIDRGGAFASLYGTWALLDEPDRRRIRGFVLNRFRGDPSLLAPAPAELCAATGVPVLGVVPYVRHSLPEEDAVGIASSSSGELSVAAIRFPHVANFDDLDPIAAEPGVRVCWTRSADVVHGADVVVLPGTRNTLADLEWCWNTGLAAAIRAAHARGAPIVGICGGYQMLGRTVADPHAIERGGVLDGLGVLDVCTELASSKTVRLTRGRISGSLQQLGAVEGGVLEGYEIHHGVTTLGAKATPWLLARDGSVLGAHAGSAWGTYLHGIFANDGFRRSWLSTLRVSSAGDAWHEKVELEIDRVADIVERSMDMRALDRWLERPA